MTSIMGLNSEGKVSDNIVEKMFSDLYHGSFHEDGLTLHNFNVYLSSLYEYHFTLSSFDDFEMLFTICVILFNAVQVDKIEDHENDDIRFGVRFGHWRENFYASHTSLSRALALAIVQDMRNTIEQHLNNGEKATAH